MPYLELPDLHLAESGPYVLAAMYHPKNEVKRKRWLQALEAKCVRKTLAKTPVNEIDPDAMSMVVQAALVPDYSTEERGSVKAVFSGHLVACALLFILSCARHAPERATLNAALRTTGAQLDRMKLRGGSRASLMSRWRLYAPVAHLWAAMETKRDLFRRAANDGRVFAEWLALAEEFRRLGESWIPLHGKEPILSPSKTWKVPERFSLPRVEVDIAPPNLVALELSMAR